MPECCICKGPAASLRIAEGNPKYRGRPVCKECQGYRRLLIETR